MLIREGGIGGGGSKQYHKNTVFLPSNLNNRTLISKKKKWGKNFQFFVIDIKFLQWNKQCLTLRNFILYQ